MLILRPESGASATVERARLSGLDAIAIPLFELEAVEWKAPDPRAFDGLLLTSANAVRLGREGLQCLRGLPVYAVGEATAQAAREAGFKVAMAGDAGVEQLLGSVDSKLRLLHLCGEHRKEVPETARNITSLVVYRSNAIGAPDLADAADSVALIHSPRAGRHFAELVRDRRSIAIAAISPAAAKAVGDGWKMVASADRPTDDALLALAARLCNNPRRT